jgi:hypothetical protein
MPKELDCLTSRDQASPRRQNSHPTDPKRPDRDGIFCAGTTPFFILDLSKFRKD